MYHTDLKKMTTENAYCLGLKLCKTHHYHENWDWKTTMYHTNL